MKKSIIYLGIIIGGLCFTSCQKEETDEFSLIEENVVQLKEDIKTIFNLENHNTIKVSGNTYKFGDINNLSTLQLIDKGIETAKVISIDKNHNIDLDNNTTIIPELDSDLTYTKRRAQLGRRVSIHYIKANDCVLKTSSKYLTGRSRKQKMLQGGQGTLRSIFVGANEGTKFKSKIKVWSGSKLYVNWNKNYSTNILINNAATESNCQYNNVSKSKTITAQIERK